MKTNRRLLITALILLLIISIVALCNRYVVKSFEVMRFSSCTGSIESHNTGYQFNSEEREEICATALEYVYKNSAKNVEFNLFLTKAIDNWTVFSLIPINSSFDSAQVFLEKVDNVWIPAAIGTSFQDLETEHPELFQVN